jgi:predicted Zn finger-like uncharacterized protein
MSLATRCSACGTTFRVVQDQLKISEGWVRCGRCNEVFNAVEGLFDLEREGLPPVEDASAAASQERTDAPAFPAEVDEVPPDAEDAPLIDVAALLSNPSPEPIPAEPHDADESDEPEALEAPLLASDAPGEPAAAAPHTARDDKIDAHLFGGLLSHRRRAPPVEVSERDRIDFSDARFDSDLLAEDADDDPAAHPLRESRSAEMPLESSEHPTPDFVRRAESRARWHRPRVRAALGVVALLLVATLALQAGNHFRDYAAVRWPALRSALTEWCAIAGCTLEAPRRIDDVSVESTALARTPGSDAFRLAVTLRSRGSVPVAVPWVDLSLTDTNGKLVARKALAVREFNPVPPVLQPGGEVVLQTLLAVRGAKVTGYTVEIFYP